MYCLTVGTKINYRITNHWRVSGMQILPLQKFQMMSIFIYIIPEENWLELVEGWLNRAVGGFFIVLVKRWGWGDIGHHDWPSRKHFETTLAKAP